MCWSGEASIGLAAVGMAATSYAIYKKESPLLWSPLLYFSLMELLQGYTYSVIDQCGLPENQIATFLGYLHICFQPFFGLLMALYFIPETVRRAVLPYGLALCSFSAIVMLIQVYPFEWAGSCTPGSILCGPQMCSVSGSWHIAWEVPINGIGDRILAFTGGPEVLGGLFRIDFPTYPLAMFIFPILFGSWRLVLYHVLLGPFLARLTTSDLNEMPAVWCLLSIGFLLLIVKTPLRKVLHVRYWPLWALIPGLDSRGQRVASSAQGEGAN
ncbi:DUF5765 domain-containing protein [uncultured Pelagimonas sp.]|uniref:DUF5765 domain-containing protein n=1 Tax=uncultured Pelagimonas sp. TaxID=1618102 RepID=UPI00262A9855|nr:DUF5765 domain-containing protein [uncultured Pelagimonas sp.]